MQRLYLQIYAAVLSVLLLLTVLMAVAFWLFDRDSGPDRWLDELTTLAEAILPGPDAPPDELRRVAQAIADPLELDLSVYAADRRLLLQVGRSLPPPPAQGGSRWLRGRRAEADLAIALADGRWVLLAGERRHRPIAHLFVAIALLGALTAVVALPISRRLTRRLERLRTHVEALGRGQLEDRVPVQGRDEIAELARAYNATADRIEQLVADKTRLLANTSHELRTPLTRVRMALALLREKPRPSLFEDVDRDIEELDELIGELLISSRLDAPEARLEKEPVDLLALAAEEAARHGDVEVSSTPDASNADALVEGDSRLLRRLLRNLIENARRHGEPPVEIEFEVGDPERVGLVIADRGPGVPESDRERIFEPFYRPHGQSNAPGGIGLGLALVRQIAERHGGAVWCEGRAGGGSRFVLQLARVAR